MLNRGFKAIIILVNVNSVLNFLFRLVDNMFQVSIDALDLPTPALELKCLAHPELSLIVVNVELDHFDVDLVPEHILSVRNVRNYLEVSIGQA